MTKGLHVSTDLILPPDTVTGTLVVYGGKGMGKTNFGSVLVEELHKLGLRFSVLDPLDVWWGLQHAAGKDGTGIDVVILGGAHGDIPIEPTAGAVVADFVTDEAVSTIVVMRSADGKMWTGGERIRFATAYCTRLFERQGEARIPLMQVIDEAGKFVPQQASKGDVEIAKCIGAIETLVEWGRNVGIGVTLITQRSARMNKSVSELAECMVAFRTTGPNSIAAIVDWFGEHVPRARQNDYVEALRSLERGHALVVSPGWLRFEGAVAMRARETFDSSATPAPGRSLRAPGKARKPDLEVYKAKMAETIERALADDPRALRDQIRELQAELRSADQRIQKIQDVQTPVVQPPAPALKLDQKAVSKLQQAAARVDSAAERIVGVGQALALAADDLEADIDRLARLTIDTPPAAGKSRSGGEILLSDPNIPLKTSNIVLATPKSSPPSRLGHAGQPPRAGRNHPPVDRPAPAGGVPGPQQRILDALAELADLGVEAPARIQVAFLAGYSNARSKGFLNPLGALSTAGLVIYPGGGTVALSEDGRALARAPEHPATTDELHERIFALLGGVARRILFPLIAAYPDAVERNALAAAAGYENARSKGFVNPLGRLRSLGFIEYPAPGAVRAREILFLGRA